MNPVRDPWIVVAWLLAALALCWGGAYQLDAGQVKVRAVAEKSVVALGQKLKIAVELDHPAKYHTWPNASVKLPSDIADFATRTEVGLDPDHPPKSVKLIGIQWPTAHLGDVTDVTGNAPTVKVPVFSGKVVVYLVLEVAPDAQACDATIPVVVAYQACDDTSCYQAQQPHFDVAVKIKDAAGAASAAANELALFSGFDESKIESASAPAPPKPTTPIPGAAIALAGTAAPEIVQSRTLLGFGVGSSLLFIALASVLGGAILNLTPCVLPIIPIKVMSLVQHAGHPKRRIVLGVWMAAGVVAFWFLVGLPMVFVSALDPTRLLFGHWWVTMSIGLLIALMGLGIMGLFSINLPQAVYMVNPKADTAHGSFLFGVMAGVLGLPCFGFVAGGLLAGAAALPPFTIIVIFVCLGIGMGTPYLILAAKPGLIEKIPRTGPASELVKQVMGLLILAAAGLFTCVAFRTLLIDKPYLSTSMPYWIAAFFVVLAGLWLIVRSLAISKSTWPKVVMPFVALLCIVGSVYYASISAAADKQDYERRLAGGVAWHPYSKEALNQGLAGLTRSSVLTSLRVGASRVRGSGEA